MSIKIDFVGVRSNNRGKKNFWGVLTTKYHVIGNSQPANYIFWGVSESKPNISRVSSFLNSQIYLKKRQKMQDGYKPLDSEAIEKHWPTLRSDLEMYILDKVLKGEIQ